LYESFWQGMGRSKMVVASSVEETIDSLMNLDFRRSP
jgi:hypothetical protein